jgi:hypothetical protein
MDGGIRATQVIGGKAATRYIPRVTGLPTAGNTGLAVEVLTAVALGYVSDMFLSREAAAAILAGGLTSPIERFLIGQGVPLISDVLTPTPMPAPNNGTTGRYPGVSAYPRPALVSGYPEGGEVGRYPMPRGTVATGRYSAADGYDPAIF